MKFRQKTLGDRGSSLIMVVIGAAFLGILGALILSITFANIDLKTANNKSKKNFYIDEVAVNEVTAVLEEYSAKSMATAYTWLVKNYQTESVDIEKCFEEYKKNYMIALSQLLNNNPSETTNLANSYQVSKLKDGVSSISTDSADATHVTVGAYVGGSPNMAGIIEHAKDSAGNNTYDYLVLKDVSITYTQANGFETEIMTDIVMDFPVAGGVDTSFAKFALISDELVNCTSAVHVTGGVYAGETDPSTVGVGDKVNPDIGGILVQSGTGNLSIDGNNNLVATRGNITAHNAGQLNIVNAKVWAKNIRTFGVGDPSRFTPKISIDAVTKVQDDLLMKAPYSTVDLKKSYYGFSFKGKSSIGDKIMSDRSSAITINAKDVSLDLTGLDNLVLFGRAFVSSSDTVDSTNEADELAQKAQSGTMMDIMTGQSIGVKYDQGIYLVPNESYLKIPSNPIDQASIQAYAADLHHTEASYDASAPHLSLKMKQDIVDFSKGDAARIRGWLDDDMPIRPIYYRQGPGTSGVKMVNFYWNFKNETCANAYFEWFYSKHGGDLKDSFKQFYRLEGGKYNMKFKKTPFVRLQVAGDFLYQNTSTGAFEIQKGEIHNMETESSQLASKYKSVQLNLREDGNTSGSVADKPYVDMHFDIREVKKASKIIEHTGIKSTLYNNDANIYISNEEEFHVTPGMTGLVIASGDVVVDAVQFEGLIVADGKIELSTNSNILADEKMILDLLSYCQNNGNKLGKYIYGYDSASKGAAGDDSVDYGKAIAFENWKKNA